MAGDKSVLRVMRTKEEAQRSYDSLSRWYDSFSGSGEFELAFDTLALLDLPSDGNILEVGFGTGRILLELARRVGENGRIYGVDLSHGMCRVARRRLEKAGLHQRILLTAGDGYRLPIAADSVDRLFMGFTLELFDTPELLPVIQGCLRVLKPGGQMGIVAMSMSDKPGFADRLYMKAHERWPRLVDCRPIDLVSLLTQAGIPYKLLNFNRLWGLSVAQLVIVKHS
jgi:ubiquinone/menaquinone biosynthesis C-methylase UbiE